MRFRDMVICCVCIALAIGLCVGAGMQLDSINRQRVEMNLVIDQPEDLPPELLFATVATGAFRGLVVDILWMRADKLKEEGLFFDARQLAEWITILQPRFASVWQFHAWNMAYNISVAIPATQPDQRWRWVRNGYELIRDEALGKYKLKNIMLYHEMARIFQHKMGGVSDDVHKYYKLQLATAMEQVLASEDNQLDSTDNRYFEALAETPVGWDQINKDPNVASLVAALKSADPNFSDDERFVSNYLSLRQNSRRYAPAAGQAIDDFRGSDALKKFDLFAKADYLRNVWKLDPARMRRLNETYGPVDFTDPNTHLPLDWRHPDTHAIYWAVEGLRIAALQKARDIEMSETNTDRIVGHSLQNLFRNGKLIIRDVPMEIPGDDPTQKPQTQMFKEVFLRPDLRMFESYNKAVLKILEKYKDDRTTYESMRNGYRNMLTNALFSFYQSGHKLQAQKIYTMLREGYPDMRQFKVPLEAFARARLLEELGSIDITNAKEQIVFLLRESFLLYAIGNDDEAAAGRESLARQVHGYYQGKYLDENRIDLPEFTLLKYFALRDFLDDKQFVPYLRLGLLARIEVEWPDLAKQLQPWKEQLERQKAEIKQQEQELIKSY